MTNDRELLRRFAMEGDEHAFRELVTRHLDLVYSVALRLVAGDVHLAQDVAQTVFVDLARKARGLSRNVVLAGWLHEATRFAAAKFVRSERRRQAREQAAMAMQESSMESTPDWAQLGPVLDAAIGELRKQDRDAVLLRFFQRKDLHSVGEALCISEDAAQKRIERALEKLRIILARRGVTLSVPMLAATISGGGIHSAPANLIVSVVTASLASVSFAPLGGFLLKIMATTKLKTALAALMVGGVAVPLFLKYQSATKPPAETQIQQPQAGQPVAENQDLVDSSSDAAKNVAPAASVVPEQPTESALLAAFRRCLLDPSEDSRHATFLQLLQSMQAADTRPVLALLEEFRKRGADLSFEQRAFWRRRGELDPEQALADLDQLAGDAHHASGTRRIEEAMTQLFRGWASKDPRAAATWLIVHQNDPHARGAFVGFMDSYARSDATGATDAVLTKFKPDDPRFNTAISTVFKAVVESSSTSDAVAWFQQLPTDQAGIKARQSVAPRMAERLMDQDPPTARAWVAEQASTPWRSWQAIDTVADSYAATDPAGAMAWISGLPPDANNGSITGVGMVVRQWARSDPAALENWIASNQDANSRLLAQVLGDYAAVVARQDYHKAVALLNQIPDQYAKVRANFTPSVQRHAPRTQQEP